MFINGFNLGRYWNIGPQQTLFVPGPILRQGDNEVSDGGKGGNSLKRGE